MLIFLVNSILFITQLLNQVKTSTYDDKNHDPMFVNEVLEDIYKLWEIKDETIIIKSDNSPTHYKNLYAF